MILSLLCSAVLLTACASSRVFGGPPQTRGLQGVDDASMTTFLYAQPNGTAALAARYAKLDADIQPGNIRYNAFWTSFEGKVPSSAQPQTCPQGTSLVPANDTDKLARGKNMHALKPDSSAYSWRAVKTIFYFILNYHTTTNRS